jgi:hypothetical protein
MPAITLKAVPKDVEKLILDEQVKIKERKKVRVYSKDLTIYYLLRELIRCRKGEEFLDD